MLYSPERNRLEGSASTGSVLPSGSVGAGVYSGRRLTLNGVKDAGKRRMGRRKKVVLANLTTRAAQALPVIVLAGSVIGVTGAYAQSASSWNKKGQDAEAHQDWDAAYEAYRQAALKKPKDLRYKAHLENTRFQAAVSHVDRGRVLRENGDFNGALTEFNRALEIDPGNQTAQQELDAVKKQLAAPQSALPPPGTHQMATQDELLQVLGTVAGPIELKPVSNEPITLHAVEDVKNIYMAIGKAAGLNVIFDPDYTSKRIPVDLTNVSLADALRIVGIEAGTFYKAVTPNTIFVAQNNRTKRTDLDELAVQTFYLTNAAQQQDANEVLTALRNLLDPSIKITLVPSQSAIILRATPDQLLLAQKLMNDLDRARPEVVVDVAILEVNRDKVRNLGITLPQSITVTPQASPSSTTSGGSSSSSGSTTTTTPSNFTINTLANLNATNFAVSIPPATLNALLTSSDTRILENPRVRATDGQRANLKIGQKIPVATGSYNAGVSTGVASIGVQTQFTYLDVGVEIDITPTVHYDRQVTLKAKMTVSSQQGSVTISGVTEPIIGQNVVEQVIQLKEGEPSILAGLVTRQDNRSVSGTPGLGELPFFKYFFASNNREVQENEIVFLLIPHIVRESVLSRMNTRAIDTGTGQSIELRRDGTLTQQLNELNAPRPAQIGQPTTAANAAAAAVQEMRQQSAPPTPPPPGTTPSQNPAQPQAQPQTPPSSPISLSVTPPAAPQSVGSTFSVAITAANAHDLYAVPLQLQYNPAVLQLVNVDAGDLLARDGQAVSIVHRDEGNGLVTISTSRPPNVVGVSGQGSVATLTFKAVAAGDSSLALVKVGARSSTQANLPAVGSQTVVHVK